jgi:drug/metabolite transporter (DMT)-like permease
MLPQAAIPFSMIFSRHIKGERFHKWQYMGAIIVILGILLVIEPMLSGRNSPEYICETNAIIFDPDEYCIMCQKETNQDSCLAHIDKTHHQTLWNDTTIHFCQWIQQTDDNKSGEDDGLVKLWALVVILSCIPMTLSSLYKEMVLSEVELHPLYLNGWTAFFQFFFSLALAIPAGKLTSPPLSSSDLMSNLHNGWSCYFNAQGSIDTGCHPDDMCEQAFWIFNLNFVMVVLYTILAIYLLKYGSTSLLYLASTITVPLGNIVFSIQSIPGYTPMHLSDILGLIVIVTGLVLYRSAAGALKEDDMINPTTERSRSENTHSPDNTSQPTMACTETTDSLQEPLLS